MAKAKTRSEIADIVLACQCWPFTLRTNLNDPNSGSDLWVQVRAVQPCIKTGVPTDQFGRKWRLSRFMTETELVRTVHMACQQFALHEIDERFKYRNERPYNPHSDIGELGRAGYHNDERA